MVEEPATSSGSVVDTHLQAATRGAAVSALEEQQQQWRISVLSGGNPRGAAQHPRIFAIIRRFHAPWEHPFFSFFSTTYP